ncbi:Zn-dependent protease [Streptomyces sp. LBL]|uniref:site-2 protease family protein n=1 Tax=Streptomyces sp. LBL TaxID=2940562 RepID=UPI0024766C88|nr:site-2 protease family protein [Streptomyces sp. LBL]MDH6629256.1 Zn-dependent protease [Streptomyces sp. LBL]
MDESGGSGQPRSGNDEPAEHPATPATPATGPARPGRPRRATDTDEAPPADEPTMVVRRLGALPETPSDAAGDEATGGESPGRSGAETPTGEASRDKPTEGRPAEGQAPQDQPSKDQPSKDQPSKDQPSKDQPSKDQAPRDHEATAAEDGTEPHAPQHADHHRTEAHTGSPEHSDTVGDRPLAHTGATKGRPSRRERGPGGGLLMGRPFGVPVYVAPSWFLVAALITWVFGGQLDRVLPELGAARYLVSLFFAIAFYASVLVHELAHTVAALRFNLPVRRIQLQFFGGVSEIEKEAETPGREFWLAFVGPLLSLVLSGLFYLALQPVEPGTVPGVLLAGLMASNLIVAVFNLLPGLPLDGGRMLRAVVWKITGRPMTGTIAAAWVGRALAVSVLIGLPLLTQSGALGSNAEDNVGMDTVMDALLAAILAAIIWTGAGNSLRMARLREHLPELRARTLTRRAVPVETGTPLSEALRRANAAGARALVVVDADGHPLSLVREAAIVGVPEHRRPWVAVSGLAQDLTEGMRVSAELAGEALLDTLRATPATEYLVVEENGEIYGVLSAADVERAFVKAMARPS